MSNSQVDPSTINANYPTAGQSNPSQGLRDNFGIIKTALERTKVELSELRNLSVTKTAIPGDVLNNDLSYNKLYRAQLHSFSQAFKNLGTPGQSVTLDFNDGTFQKVITSGSLQITLANFPKGSQVGSLRLWVITTGADHIMVLPPSVTYGIKADYVSNGTILFNDPGHYLVEFTSVDNGETFWVTALHGLEEFAAIQSSGAGYELPIALVNRLGGVKPDGVTVTVDVNTGVMTVIGAVPSDSRLKTDVEPIGQALERIQQVRGVTYTEIASGRAGTGVIAQELEKVLPQAVEQRPDGYLGVHYGNMAGLFVECIKELNQQIQQLQAEIAELKKS